MIRCGREPSTLSLIQRLPEAHVRLSRSTLLLVVFLPLFSCSDAAPSHLFGTPEDWCIGARHPRVVLLEYGDYQCPPCVALHLSMVDILANHPDDVRFVFRHFPTRRHRNAEKAAEVAEAAGAQGKFWQMHAKLYENQRDWYGLSDPMPAFMRYARDVGLDVPRFIADVRSARYQPKIRASKDEARRLGVRGTPALFINGERVHKLPLRPGDLETHVVDALRREPPRR